MREIDTLSWVSVIQYRLIIMYMYIKWVQGVVFAACLIKFCKYNNRGLTVEKGYNFVYTIRF